MKRRRRTRSARATTIDALVALVQAGRLAALGKAVRGGADPNGVDEKDRTLLVHAAIADRHEVARWLLLRGVAPDRRDRFGLHALHYAAWHASRRLLALLLERMPAETPEDDGTPLFYAQQSRSGARRKMALLLRRGADLRRRMGTGADLVQRAAYAGRTAECRWLLARGAPLDEPGPGGETALMMALAEGHGETARLLLEAGADPLRREGEGDGGTALIAAARGKLLDCARLLIARGADVRAADANGETALHHAVRNNHLALAEALLEAGAAPDHQDGDGTTPLMMAADCLGGLPMARLLLAAGARKELRDHEGLTAADIAEYSLDPELVEALR